jgi:hypothetical protein
LKKILTYHVVAGKLTAKDIAKKIKAGGGKATLTTVEGGTLTAMMQGGKLVLTDEKGGTATVTIANVFQSNGVIHVIDTVLLPNCLGYAAQLPDRTVASLSQGTGVRILCRPGKSPAADALLATRPGRRS